MRIITGSPYGAPVEPPLIRLILSNIKEMVYKESASMVQKEVNIKAQIYLDTLLNKVCNEQNTSQFQIKHKTSTKNKQNMDKTIWIKWKKQGPCFGMHYQVNESKTANIFQSFK